MIISQHCISKFPSSIAQKISLVIYSVILPWISQAIPPRWFLFRTQEYNKEFSKDTTRNFARCLFSDSFTNFSQTLQTNFYKNSTRSLQFREFPLEFYRRILEKSEPFFSTKFHTIFYKRILSTDFFEFSIRNFATDIYRNNYIDITRFTFHKKGRKSQGELLQKIFENFLGTIAEQFLRKLQK